MSSVQTQNPAPEPKYFQTRHTCLFLDVDGTLVDFELRPDQVRIDDELLLLLSRIRDQLGGALALVSGRPLAELDALFAPLQLPTAGIHGFERRCSLRTTHRPDALQRQLDEARSHIQQIVVSHPGLLLEDKHHGLALHYRAAPQLADLAMRTVEDCAGHLDPQFVVLEGSCVVEVKPAAHTKATAVEAFLAEDPFEGRIPIYIGDDRTDFDGFRAVRRHHGVDIAVGDRIPGRWRLENPAAVRSWLQRFADQGERSRH